MTKARSAGSESGVTSYLSEDELAELVDAFPTVDFAFAYGSGVVHQQGYAKRVSTPAELPMLDLVLATNDSAIWHKANLERNSDHYSGLARLLGADKVTRFQEDFGAKMYYNALVPMATTSHRGRSMKYGVISTHHLEEDLREWSWLYAAGRLHKPVRVIQENGGLKHAIEENLQSALKSALLLLPEAFTEEQLYDAIAGLSYTGDFRMYFGENPDKVHNIVTVSLNRFRELYAPAIKAEPGLMARGHDGSNFEQDTSPTARCALAETLPRALREGLTPRKGGARGGPAASAAPTAQDVSRALAAIVSRSSLRQGGKGLLTAGLLKSASYSLAKVGQAMAGRLGRGGRPVERR